MQDVIWNGRPTLRKPVMVCAFNGWNDAGEAASAAVAFIRSSFDAEEVASIDPEEFFDFTAVRPTVRLTEGVTREIDWPVATISAAAVPGAEGDLVMLQATEPDRPDPLVEGPVVTLEIYPPATTTPCPSGRASKLTEDRCPRAVDK